MPDYSDTRLQFRRGTFAEWAAANPVLASGEPGYDVTNKILKVGDGTTAFASLSGISGGGGGGGGSTIFTDLLDSPANYTSSAGKFIKVNSAESAIEFSTVDIVSDTTPQLGGNLDLNSKNITGTGDIDLQGTIDSDGAIQGSSIKRIGGTSSQFLKADGSVDSNTYLTSASALANVVEDTTPQLGGTLDTNSQSVTGGIRSDTVGIDLDSAITVGTPLQVYDFADTQPFFAVRAGSAFISAIFGPSTASANCRTQYYSSNTTTGNYWRQDASQTTYSLTRVDGNSADDTVFSITNSATTFTGNVGVTGIITGTSLVKSGGTSSEFLKADGSVDSSTYLTSYTETDTLANVTGRGATTTTTSVIPFYYANQSAFPSATTYHGAIAHSHSDGAMYFAHGGSWNKLANSSDISNSSNWDTAYGWGDHSTAGYLTGISGITVSNFDAATIVTESEDIASNDNDTTLPTSAAVKDYIDTQLGGGGMYNLVEDTTPQLGGTLDTNSQAITGGIRSDTVGIDLDSAITVGTPLQVYDFADAEPFFAVRAGSAFISAIFGPSTGSANNRIHYYSSNTTTANYWRQDASETTYSLTRVDGGVADDTVFSIVNSGATFNENLDVQGTLSSSGTFTNDGYSSRFNKGLIINNDGTHISSAFQVKGGGSEDYLIQTNHSTNRVGIRTNAPAATLDVNGDVAVTGTFTVAGDVTLASTGTILNSPAFGAGMTVKKSVTFNNDGADDSDFQIKGDNITHLFFADTTNDRIGINTSSPQHQLDVTGMGRFVHADGMCGLQVEDTGGSGLHIGDCALDASSAYAGIKHSDHGTSDYMMISNGVTTFLSAVNNGAVILRGGGNDSNSEIQVKDVGVGGVGITFNEQGADRDVRMEGVSNTNLFRLDASTDRIGIGTGTPASTLDVDGTLTATTLVKSGGTSSQFLKADGSVDSSTYLTAETNDLSAAVTWANVPDANITQGSVTQHQAALSITESQISDLRSGGSVFNEAGASVDFRVEGDTNENLLFVDGSADKVGIGINDPDYLFQVEKDTKDLAGFTRWYTTGPVGSGNIQNLVIQGFSGAGAKGIYLSHYCNENGGSETQTLKNVIRMGEGIISLDDAYTTGLSTTYYPKLQVNTETGAVTFNNTYTFPTADGSADQVLKTDGAGNISFGTLSTTNLDTTNFSAATIVTEAEGIGSNDNDTTLPTSAAVKDYADTKVASNTSAVSNSVAVSNIVMITQTNYDALSSYDANTLYFIIS
tara:strand:- start:603 stop:4337 length:3735 start_codon:yes stop_codon:yes gene_type:complete